MIQDIYNLTYTELKEQKETLSTEVETLTTELESLMAKRETTESSLEQLLAEMKIREERAISKVKEGYALVISGTNDLLEMGIDPETISLRTEPTSEPTPKESEVSGESEPMVESESPVDSEPKTESEPCATPPESISSEDVKTESNPHETSCETNIVETEPTDIHTDEKEVEECVAPMEMGHRGFLLTPFHKMLGKKTKYKKETLINPTTDKRMVAQLNIPFHKLCAPEPLPFVVKLGNRKARYNYPDPDESRAYSADGLAPTITRTHSNIMVYISPRLKQEKLYLETPEFQSSETPVDAAKTITIPSNAEKLEPLIPYVGGKSDELKYILPAIPETFDRYFEPFVGGGAVMMNIKDNKRYVNDFCKDIISLYRYVANSDQKFLGYIKAINQTWERAKKFVKSKFEVLYSWFGKYQSNVISEKDLQQNIDSFCDTNKDEILDIVEESGLPTPVLLKNAKVFLPKKMKKLYDDKVQDRTVIEQYIEVAVKQALYNNYRFLYNDKKIAEENPQLHTAMYQFIRYYCFSGLEHYNKKGDFNTPYGANPSYNAKSELTKLKQYTSGAMINHLSDTEFWNCDFEAFLKETQPSKNDFIFLDPPYDCVFTRYSDNEFNGEDHKRLANYLLNECEAKWMMIIGKTDFIENLYHQKGIYIYPYGKEYSVNLQKRNDRKMTHLMITNYKLADEVIPPYEVVEEENSEYMEEHKMAA